MRNLLGFGAVLFLLWATGNIVALICDLLFSNLFTGAITFLAMFIVPGWFAYKVVTRWLDKNEKEGNN